MLNLRNILLTPDAPDASGGAAAPSAAPTPEAAPANNGQAGGSPNPATTSAQPGGRFVSDDEYSRLQRFEQKAKASDQWYTRLQQRGYKSFDDAFDALDQFGKVRSDPGLSKILDALLNEQTQAGAPESSQTATNPLDPAKLPDYIRQQVQDQLRAEREAQFKAQYESDREAENNLLQGVVQDERLSKFFGGKSFDDAYNGQAGKAAQLVAILLDAQFGALAGQYSNGQPRPITDPAVAKQAVSNVLEGLKELNAILLLSASTDTSAPNAPPAQSNLTDNNPQGYRGLPKAEDVIGTFQKSFQRAMAGQGGLPLSQSA